MTSAFTHMANSVALAFSGPDEKATTSVSTPTKVATTSSSLSHGISPGRRIELQERLFNQIDMLHRMYEKGAITSRNQKGESAFSNGQVVRTLISVITVIILCLSCTILTTNLK